jgi:hypothetical protein
VSKQLVPLSKRWWDVDDRVKEVWGDLASLIMQFNHPNSGAYSRLADMLEMLEERLGALGANTAQDAAAAADKQVQQLLAEIDRAKVSCRKISTQYWQLRSGPKGAVFDELKVLKRDLEKVVKEKSGIFARSKSVPVLKELMNAAKMLDADAYNLLRGAPLKPDNAEIN